MLDRDALSRVSFNCGCALLAQCGIRLRGIVPPNCSASTIGLFDEAITEMNRAPNVELQRPQWLLRTIECASERDAPEEESLECFVGELLLLPFYSLKYLIGQDPTDLVRAAEAGVEALGEIDFGMEMGIHAIQIISPPHYPPPRGLEGLEEALIRLQMAPRSCQSIRTEEWQIQLEATSRSVARLYAAHALDYFRQVGWLPA